MGDDRGQASIEWIALIALLVIALVVAGATASGAPIAGLVVRQFDRALCIVGGGGDCFADRRPCVVGADESERSKSVTVLFVHSGSTHDELIEHLSDGTWLVTYTHHHAFGLETGFGAKATVHGLGVAVSLGGEVRAAALAQSGPGQTWRARSEGQAARIAKLLAEGHTPPGRPAQTYDDSGDSLQASTDFGIKGVPLSGGLERDHLAGTRHDTATGQTTRYIDADSSDTLSAGSPSPVGPSLARHASSQVEYAITSDNHGRPLDFDLVTTTHVTTGVRLSVPLASVGLGTVGPNTEVETEQHLDLTDSDDLATVRAYLAARHGGDFGTLVAATRALDARFAQSGTLQISTYAVSSGGSGASGVVFGPSVIPELSTGLGASTDHEHTTTRLRASAVRGPDGIWTVRGDCLRAAKQGARA